MKDGPLQFYNRYSGAIETEAIYGEPFLRWAYGNPLGRLSVQLIAKRLWFSAWYGRQMNRPASRSRIRPFVKRFGLDPGEFVKPLDQFEHFNDFFARDLKPEARPIAPSTRCAVFPADGRHMGFQDLSAVDAVFVKGQPFNLPALFQDTTLAERYQRGAAVLSRLCPTDYHRFHFVVGGKASRPVLLGGHLYSVSPLALRRRLAFLWQNKRMLTQLSSPEFGRVVIVEFGAANVGSIHQTFQPEKPVLKGQEKGFFMFGGSAVMTFFEPGRAVLAKDILQNTRNQRETYARMGDAMALRTA